MLNYNIIIYLTDGNEIFLSVTYEKEYELDRDIKNLGVNGIIKKSEDKSFIEYFPPHRIMKIEVKKI